MAEVTLTHSLVNGGIAVTINNVEVSYGWKNLVNVDPAEAYYDIVPSQNKGFENPTIKLTGVIDIEDVDTNEMTQEHLVNFATLRNSTPISLSISAGGLGAGGTATYLKGRPSGGYSTDGSNSLSNSINIIIDSFDFDFDTGSEQGHIWNYSITFHETRTP